MYTPMCPPPTAVGVVANTGVRGKRNDQFCTVGEPGLFGHGPIEYEGIPLAAT